MAVLRRTLPAAVVVAVLAACTAAVPEAALPTLDPEALRAESTPPPTDRVSLTVYYRYGRGARAYLTPVLRDVPVPQASPETALQLLLAGPRRAEDPQLYAPLPTTTEVRSFDVREGVAAVTLSSAAVADARSVGRRSEHEALALAAVANTLTEFPEIQRVRLRVEGQEDARFWGYWGVPHTLLRDTSVVDAKDRQHVVPPLDEFSPRRQRVGVRHRGAQPAIAAVRARSFATYTRLTVEVTAADGSQLSGPVPPALAQRVGRNRLVLQVHGQPSAAVAGNLMRKLDDPAYRDARVHVRGKPHRVVVTLRQRRAPQFWLHTVHQPARVVLDIRR